MPGNWEDFLFSDDNMVRRYCYWLAGLFGSGVVWESGGHLRPSSPENAESDFGIISLNYDLILEGCLDLVNSQTTPHGTLRFRSTIEGPGLPLAKIHGSVSPLTIVPPTWQKLGNEQVREAWRLAVHMLRGANEVRILGFSFPQSDGYIRYLLSLGAMRAEHLKRIDVVCLDPSGEVRRRYSDFVSFPDFRFISGDLKDYFGKYGERTDEKVPGSQNERSVRFRGLNENHERWMGQWKAT
jgi:hypothetical protein